MDAGYINMQMHPSAPLYIYNYSKMCQIDKMWNDTTEKCRGLIVDSNDNIISRPFRKFYNYSFDLILTKVFQTYHMFD